MITEERLKYYRKEVTLHTDTAVQFLMDRAGSLTSMATTGLTAVQYKINSGSYSTPSYPIAYSANDVISFTYTFTDATGLRGNIVLYGKDT